MAKSLEAHIAELQAALSGVNAKYWCHAPAVKALIEALDEAQIREKLLYTANDGLGSRIEELEAAEVKPVKLSAATSDVIAERQRQVSAEGWTAEHDDEHSNGELAGSAACYAKHVNSRGWIYATNPESYQSENESSSWPWSPDWWKPSNPRRDLVKAGALILAEIERLDRAAGIQVEGGVMSKELLFGKIQALASECHQIACSLDVGEERSEMFEVYNVLLNLRRKGYAGQVGMAMNPLLQRGCHDDNDDGNDDDWDEDDD